MLVNMLTTLGVIFLAIALFTESRKIKKLEKKLEDIKKNMPRPTSNQNDRE